MILRSYQTPHQVRVVPLMPVNGSVASVPRQRDYIYIRPAPVAVRMLPTSVRIVPSIDEIQRATAEYFGVALKDMKSERRSAWIAHPRQFAMWLAGALTNASLVMIGRGFGDRDHSTVHHAIKRVEERMAADLQAHADMRLICARVARATERRDWEFRRGRTWHA